MAIITRHTYSDLLYTGGRLAECEWDCGGTLAEGVAATISVDPEVIILWASDWTGANAKHYRGMAPGGIG